MEKFITIVGVILLLIGVISVLGGIITLLRFAFSKNLTEIQNSAEKLAQKGLLSDTCGTMDCASVLIREISTLMGNARGIGLTLVIIGGGLIAAGIYIIKLTIC